MTNDKAKKEYDAMCIENWVLLIRKFNQMWNDGEPKEAFSKFKETVKSTHPLTFRQLDALIARCDNVMNGTYGNTKRQEHYEHDKPSKKV